MTLIGILVAIILLISSCSIYISKGDERKVKQYMQAKFNKEIKMVDKASINEGNMGDVWHTVALKENSKIKFKVHVEGLFFIDVLGDEYEQGLEAYEEYKKLEPRIATMKDFGFEKMKERNFVEYDYFSDEPEVTHTCM
jgi:hypothetical protein